MVIMKEKNDKNKDLKTKQEQPANKEIVYMKATDKGGLSIFLALICALIGVFALAIVFVPLAIIFLIIGMIKAIKNNGMENVIVGVITIIVIMYAVQNSFLSLGINFGHYGL